MITLESLAPASAEVFLAIAGIALLLLGVLRRNDSTGFTSLAAMAAMAVAAVLTWTQATAPMTAFSDLFVVDAFTAFAKIVTLAAAAVSLWLINTWARIEQAGRFELPVIVLFATLGMLLMISANDLISLYVGLELQSLALYVLAAFQRSNLRATEAGVKYFVLGALASGLLLYGASLVYGFAGTTAFTGLAEAAKSAEGNLGVIVGVVFIIAGLAFKVSAVPFHMWTPDVYEGAPTPITAFFSVAPKIAGLALFLRVLVGPFGPMIGEWQQVIVLIAALSMGWGAVAAIAQPNIKRLMAYSSIGNVGYALIGLAVGTPEGARGMLFYMAIYIVMNLGAFACILAMRVRGRYVTDIADLSGLSKTNPVIALCLATLMFSMAGIPPLAGFLGKFYVFVAAINAGMAPLAVFGLLASVVSAYYYLRLIKIMYFDAPRDAFDRPSFAVGAVMTVCSLLMLLLFVMPAALVGGADTAAKALFVG